MAKNNSSNKTFKSKSKVYAIYGNSGNKYGNYLLCYL